MEDNSLESAVEVIVPVLQKIKDKWTLSLICNPEIEGQMECIGVPDFIQVLLDVRNGYYIGTVEIKEYPNPAGGDSFKVLTPKEKYTDFFETKEEAEENLAIQSFDIS